MNFTTLTGQQKEAKANWNIFPVRTFGFLSSAFDLMITFCAPIHSIFSSNPRKKKDGKTRPRETHRIKAIFEWKINKHGNRKFIGSILREIFNCKPLFGLWPYRWFPIYWLPFARHCCSLLYPANRYLGERESWHGPSTTSVDGKHITINISESGNKNNKRLDMRTFPNPKAKTKMMLNDSIEWACKWLQEFSSLFSASHGSE